jgi:hypothetical protein
MFRSYPLANSRVDINRLKDSTYDVIISVLISNEEITTQSTLDCELKIPDTPYVKRKTFVFFQGKWLVLLLLLLLVVVVYWTEIDDKYDSVANNHRKTRCIKNTCSNRIPFDGLNKTSVFRNYYKAANLWPSCYIVVVSDRVTRTQSTKYE